MHPAITALINEHAQPTRCSKRQVHDQATPILTVAAQAQQQVARYRELLLAVEHAPHDHVFDGKIEALHQTLGAAEKAVAELVRTGRTATKAFTQLERVIAEVQNDLARYEAATSEQEATA